MRFLASKQACSVRSHDFALGIVHYGHWPFHHYNGVPDFLVVAHGAKCVCPLKLVCRLFDRSRSK